MLVPEKTSGPSCVTSRPSDSVRMIASLKSERLKNAERGIETGIPFEVDSRISTDKRVCVDWSGQLPGGRQLGNNGVKS
jgi:hypothetical protein